ncbi:MAG: hypothetical protein Q7S33_05245 [Nanoarchaeota archaeon]|nr:hypothetical protein [Nanoarchaeota archaeon]
MALLKEELANFKQYYFNYFSEFVAKPLKNVRDNFFNGLYEPYITEEREKLGLDRFFSKGLHLPRLELDNNFRPIRLL